MNFFWFYQDPFEDILAFVQKKDSSNLSKFLAKSKIDSSIFYKIENNEPILFLAIKLGSNACIYEILEYLKTSEPNHLKAILNYQLPAKRGRTLLIAAAIYNNFEAVKILIKAGADPNVSNNI